MAVTVRDITREFDDISHQTVLYSAGQKGWIEHPHMIDWSQWTFDQRRADELRALLYAHLHVCTEVLQFIYTKLRQGDDDYVEVAAINQQLGHEPDDLRECLDTLARKGLVAYQEEEGRSATDWLVLTEVAVQYLDEQELEKLYDRSLSWEPPFMRPGHSVDT
jgi:hypothetical protein